VHYADANELANTLKSIIPPALPGKTPTAIAADKNSNSILISGSTQERENIRMLIKRMDDLTVQTTKMNSAMVVHLKYLKAEDFAPVLQNVAQGMNSPAASGSSSDASVGMLDNSAKNIGPQSPTNAMRALFTASTPGKSDSSSTLPRTTSNTSSGESDVSIQAEPATNSLIIDGPPGQVRSLKNIIAQLDKKPRQVLVEAFIAEVNEGTAQKLGIQWGTLPPGGETLTPLPTDTSFATITGGLGLGIVEMGRIKTLISAIKDDSATNILSTPSLVVLDNEEADLKVGQKASFSTGSLVNTASQNTVVNATEERDVSLQLKVTPQISLNDSIRLKVEHQNDVLTNKIQNGNPIVNDSQFSTSVLINSGQILVIGGLMTNDTEEGVRKVPLLGSIPGIGRLFQSRDDSVTKKNLLIFLRPIVLHDKVANAETFSRYSMIRGLQLDRQKDTDILVPQGANNSVLPKWGSSELPVPLDASHS
jgi:general secretion pathway protein D